MLKQLYRSFRLGALMLCLLTFNQAMSQKKQTKVQAPVAKRYTQSEVLDSLDGIKIYNKLIAALGGDSVRYNKEGQRVEGWVEDYYTNGKPLHKGFYKTGQLDLFRNFYANGKNERIMATIDPTRVNVDMYYENGNQRRQVNYYNGKPKKLAEFYPNGLLKKTEEFDVERNFLISRKTWYENGIISSELSYDPKTKKYFKKTYHNNGKLFESGQVIYSQERDNYFKTGTWTITDSEGKNKKYEKHSGFKSVAN